MRRALAMGLVFVLTLLPVALAAAGAAAYGTLRRDAIKAVNACRNMATVSGQMDQMAADVATEAKAIQEGIPGRIAVVRERVEVLAGKTGELERKVVELHELAEAMKTSAAELQADIDAKKQITKTPAPEGPAPQ